MMYYQNLNGKALEVGTAAASAGASVAAASAGLFTSAAAAQAVPVVGQVLGLLAIAGGLLLRQKAKVKGIKSNIAAVEAQNIELRKTSLELDTQIGTVGQQVAQVNNQLQSMGLSGLGEVSGLSTWLKKTFTPVRYQKSVLKTKEQDNAELTQQVERKLSALEDLVNKLDALSKKFAAAASKSVAKAQQNIEQNQQSYLLAGGAVLIGLIWYFNRSSSPKTSSKKS